MQSLWHSTASECRDYGANDEVHAWVVFARPRDASLVDPNQRSSSESLMRMARSGAWVQCMELSASKATFSHVTLLFESGCAYSITLDSTRQSVHQWSPEGVRDAQLIDDVESKRSYKSFRRLCLSRRDAERLEEVAARIMANSQYPRMAYWSALIFGYVINLNTIARFTSGPNHLNCAMYIFRVLYEARILTPEERETYDILDFIFPDSLLRIPSISRLIEVSPNDVASRMEKHANRMPAITHDSLPVSEATAPRHAFTHNSSRSEDTEFVDVTDLVHGSDFYEPGV